MHRKNISLESGWIICPSKSFPGKFYYFNVLNGETLWSLYDKDFKNIQNDSNLHKVTNQHHTFPEPENPPEDHHNPQAMFTHGPSNHQQPTFANNPTLGKHTPMFANTNTPMFGKSVWPKYPNMTNMNGVNWTPVQFLIHTNLPVPCANTHYLPMMSQEIPSFNSFDHSFTKFDHDSRENMTAKFDDNRPQKPLAPEVKKKVQSSIFKRAVPHNSTDFENNVTKSFNTEMKNANSETNLTEDCNFETHVAKSFGFENAGPNCEFQTSTPKPSFDEKRKQKIKLVRPKSVTKEPILKMDGIEPIDPIIKEFNEKVNLAKVDINQNSEIIGINHLDSTDLRHVLLAKKKKADVVDNEVKCKKIKLIHNNQEKKVPSTKKKVTFSDEIEMAQVENVTHDNKPSTSVINSMFGTDISDSQNNVATDKKAIFCEDNQPKTTWDLGNEESMSIEQENNQNINMTGNTKGTSLFKDGNIDNIYTSKLFDAQEWYIIADTNIFINYLQDLDKLLKLDPNCRLIVPKAVYTEVSKLCNVESNGQMKVINARQLIRRITENDQYIAEPTSDKERGFENIPDGILNCCLQARNTCHNVVLITNNQNLFTKAKSLALPTYTIQDIHNGVTIKPNIQSDQKFIITVEDNNDSSKYSNFPVHVYRENLFTFGNKQNCEIKYDIDKLVRNIIFEVNNTSKENINKHLEKQTTESNKNNIFNLKMDNSHKEMLHFDNDKCKYGFDLSKTYNAKIDSKTKSIFDPGSPERPNKVKDSQIFIDKTTKISTTSNSDKKTTENLIKSTELQREANNTSTQRKNSASNDKCVPSSSVVTTSIDEEMKLFKVRDEMVKEKLFLRMEEWLCSYTQIMEDILNDLLKYIDHKQSKHRLCLREVLLIIKTHFNQQTRIKYVAEKLYYFLLDHLVENTKGNLELNLTPDGFVHIFGAGVVLIQSLRIILPHFENLLEAENLLQSLYNEIENTNLVPDSELTSPTVNKDCDEKPQIRCNFVKDDSYIVEYLRKHFKSWESYKIQDIKPNDQFKVPYLPALKKADCQELKIVRTSGKNLNMYKIDLNKSLYVSNTGNNSKNDGPKVVKILEDEFLSELVKDKTESMAGPQTTAKIDTIDTQNTFTTTAGPKVIRNLKLIDEYEDRIKNKKPIDYDALDYSEYLESSISELNISDVNTKNQITEDLTVNNDKNTNNYANNDVKQNNDDNEITQSNDNNVKNHITQNNAGNVNNDVTQNNDGNVNNDATQNNDSYIKTEISDDSGIDNESSYAQSVLQMFLYELTSSFKAVQDFINKVTPFTHRKTIDKRTKNNFHIKATKALDEIVAIKHNLESIVKRESDENTVLKSLLQKQGMDTEKHKEITEYRVTVQNFLKHAHLLEETLTLIKDCTK